MIIHDVMKTIFYNSIEVHKMLGKVKQTAEQGCYVERMIWKEACLKQPGYG